MIWQSAGAFVWQRHCVGSPGDDVDNSCFIANIRGVQTQNADAMPGLVDSAGQLGTASSSQGYKKEINPMKKAGEPILAVRPVTFHNKTEKTVLRNLA